MLNAFIVKLTYQSCFEFFPFHQFVAWILMGVCIFVACILDLLCRQYCCKREDSDVGEEILYERLSEERKLDLDNLRSSAILHKLSRYTLTVSVENMLKKRQSDSDTISSTGDETSSAGNDLKEKDNCEQSNNDVETGMVDGDTTYEGSKDDYSVGSKDDSEYTHVMLPLPGHAITVSDVVMPDDCSIEKEKKTIRSITLQKLQKLSLLTSRVGKNIINNEEEKPPCTPDEPCPNDHPDDEVVTENRAVPMFCAVCLSKYTLADRVCWSSNTECTHVFHEECMLPWLVTLGRNKSKKKSYSTNPSEAKLLDFDLSCPCCRQEFISSSLIIRKEETIEEADERV